MSNYPTGAEYDSRAPYNESDYDEDAAYEACEQAREWRHENS